MFRVTEWNLEKIEDLFCTEGKGVLDTGHTIANITHASHIGHGWNGALGRAVHVGHSLQTVSLLGVLSSAAIGVGLRGTFLVDEAVRVLDAGLDGLIVGHELNVAAPGTGTLRLGRDDVVRHGPQLTLEEEDFRFAGIGQQSIHEVAHIGQSAVRVGQSLLCNNQDNIPTNSLDFLYDIFTKS